MRILTADDDVAVQKLLQFILGQLGHEVIAVGDGGLAWEALDPKNPAAAHIAVLDWNMPGLSGPDLCRRVRAAYTTFQPYLILLSANDRQEDINDGLASGADDYLVKPFDRNELRARVQIGVRVVELQRALADRVKALEEALHQVSQLKGLLPICSYCKKIRDDKNYWQQVDSYITRHSPARFSHGICPDCYAAIVQPELDRYSAAAALEGRSPAGGPPSATPLA